MRSCLSELPNIAVLVEAVMSIGVSNGFVESCFSFLTALLSDRRLSMTHDTMADLLLIRVNHQAWSENERDEIINDALKQYMQTRRKLKIDSGCSEPPKKLSACTSYSAADSAVSNIENAAPGAATDRNNPKYHAN